MFYSLLLYDIVLDETLQQLAQVEHLVSALSYTCVELLGGFLEQGFELFEGVWLGV